MLSLVAGCLALRTRSGRLKNSFNSVGTLPVHLVGPKKWTCIGVDIRGLLKRPDTYFSYMYLLCITFWFTLHLGDTRQESPYTWRTENIIQLHVLAQKAWRHYL